MPFHSTDKDRISDDLGTPRTNEFREHHKFGNRSKETMEKRFTKSMTREWRKEWRAGKISTKDKQAIPHKMKIYREKWTPDWYIVPNVPNRILLRRDFNTKKRLHLDFSVNDKERLPIPTSRRQHELDNHFLYGEWNRIDFLKCVLCAKFTSIKRQCTECEGYYFACSSHRLQRCLCRYCGVKCRVCKDISSRRFDNPLKLKDRLNRSENSIKRKSHPCIPEKRHSVSHHEIIDVCDCCVDVISDKMEDGGVTKSLGLMIMGYTIEK